MNDPIHGHTKSGTPITDALIEDLADEAERGFDPEQMIARRGRRGRPRSELIRRPSSRYAWTQSSRICSCGAPRPRAFPSPKSSARRFGITSRRAERHSPPRLG